MSRGGWWTGAGTPLVGAMGYASRANRGARITGVTSSGGAGPNEPAGMTVLSDNPMTSLTMPTDWTWVENIAGHTAVTGGFIVVTYFAGHTGSDAISRFPFDIQIGNRKRIVYGKHLFTPSSGWEANASGDNKIVYAFFPNGNGGVTGDIVFEMGGSGTTNGDTTSPLTLFIAAQNTVSTHDFGGAPNPSGAHSWNAFGNITPAAAVPRGSQSMLEYVLTMNTNGNADGRLQTWLNGVSVHDLSAIQFTSDGSKWSTIENSGIWGGGGGTVQTAFTMTWGDTRISGKD